MLDMDGFEFCCSFCLDVEIDYILVLIFMGCVEIEDIVEGLCFGVDGYLVKFFELEEFEVCVMSFIVLCCYFQMCFCDWEIFYFDVVVLLQDEIFFECLWQMIQVCLGDLVYLVKQLVCDMVMECLIFYKYFQGVVGVFLSVFLRDL